MYHGERFNAWSHLLGAVAACIGAVWMLVVASLDGSPWKIVSVAIYGFTLMVLYSASTVYHSVRGRRKRSCKGRSLFDLPVDRRQLHTVLPGDSARAVGLDAVRDCVGAGGDRHPAGDQKPRSGGADSVHRDLRGDGLDRTRGSQAADSGAGHGRVYLVGVGRRVVHRGHHLFALEDRLRHSHGIWHLFVIGGSLLHFVAIMHYVL